MYRRRRPGAGDVPLIQINNSILTGGTYTALAGRSDDDDVPSGTGRRMGADGSFRFNGKVWKDPRGATDSASGEPQSLKDIVALDALLNSHERYPAPKCHPDTRKAALEIVTNWIWNHQAGFKGIMWVSGAPGVGKSALCQTVCEILAGPYNPIHASFFFGRGQGARELAASLAPTIAYQFTFSSIVCRWYIWYLLRNEPTILREALHSQFRKLVQWPASVRSYIQRPMVVVIDGLDECIDAQERVSLLELIFEAAKNKSIRFLIASRPEQEIVTFFNHPSVAQHVDHIILDEETFKTSKDIRIFLRSEFARIRESHPDLTFDLVDGVEWPGDAIIDRVTVDSDGQFIFATLFIGYIDEELFSPQEQLDTLLKPPGRVAAFSKLDRLYHQILTRRPRHMDENDDKFVQYQETAKAILFAVFAWPIQLSAAGIAKVLGEDTHVVQHIVRGPLRTLFKVQGPVTDPKIAFYHKSFRDCLADPKRSGEFHVPPNALHLLFHRILSRPPPSHPSQTFSREQLVGVLQVLVSWPCQCAEDGIAAILGLDDDTVGRVIAPFMGLLFARFNEGEPQVIYIRWVDFQDFLADPQRSGEFHVPPDALDLLYHRILSRPPPSDPSQTFTREQLVGVLYVVVVWPGVYTEEQIASVLGLDTGTVGRVIAPFMGLLFAKTQVEGISFCWTAFQDFLADPQRSGEFHVPPNALDLHYHRILSRPPPSDPSQTFTREQLIGVLHVVFTWPAVYTEDEITSLLDLDNGTVSRVVTSLLGLLFRKTEENRVFFGWVSFREFLLDPQRAGEFHVPPNTLDRLFHRILSRPPPSDPLRTFSREQLVSVIQVIAAVPGGFTDDQIAPFLGWDSGTVSRVTAPFMGVLFGRNETGCFYFRWKVFEDFLADPQRSGEFHVPPNALDRLFHRTLSRPPPSDPLQTFSQEQLVGVIQAIAAAPGGFTDDQIAPLLGLDSGAVGRVTAPFMGALFGRTETGCFYFRWKVFEDFLADRQRAGEFHVPPNALDLLFHRILARPPPSDPLRTFSREQLVGVLHVVVALPGAYTEDQIASVLGLGSGTAGRVVAPFMGSLFRRNENGCVYFCWKAFEDFLADSQRSGELHVPPNAVDLLFHRILARPPPSDPPQTFSREQLFGVLQVVAALPGGLTDEDVASLLGFDSGIVGRVVVFFMDLLFGRTKEDRIFFRWKAFEDFLADRQRAGEFHVPPNALDLLFHRILARPPPSDPLRTFSREQLVGVLHVVVALPGAYTEDQIASVLGLGSGTAGRVVAPFMGSLFRRNENGCVYFCWKAFEDFLADPQRAGEFHVPPNALDRLFYRILARPPPSHPSQTFSREQLVEVLHVVAALPGGYTEGNIASVLGWDSGTVGRVVIPFTGLIFGRNENGCVYFCCKAFEDFLADPQCSGEFHVPPNALDRLFHRILSRPRPSDRLQTFSQEQLLGVLQVIAALPGGLTDEDVASLLGLDSGIVGRVVVFFMDLLFGKTEEGRLFFRWKSFGGFLADAQRSGEFHVPPNALDRLFYRILACPPPSHPSQTFSREQLVEVLHVVAAKPGGYTEDNIASVLGWDSGTVDRVVDPLMGSIFRRTEHGFVYFCWKAFEDFLKDPQRSREFHVPPNAVDLLFHRILTRPPPSAQTFSQEQLFGVLQVIAALPGGFTEDDIASFLGLDSGTVGSIVVVSMDLLLRKTEEGRLFFRWKAFEDFLKDPQGEFYVPTNALVLLSS